MSNRSRPVTAGTIAITAIVAVAAAAAVGLWLVGAPRALGGSSSYITTHGTSMQPTLEAGDLAVVRPADRYEVGDVVAYRSSILNRVVMHRIVALTPGGYRLQGDNNSWVDADQVTDADIVGRLGLHVPRLGAALAVFRTPWGAAVLVLPALLLSRERPRLGRDRKATAAMLQRSTITSESSPIWTLSCVAVIAVAAATAAVGFAHPAAVESQQAHRSNVTTHFSYGATVPPSAAYPTGQVRADDPVFIRLAPVVTFRAARSAGDALAPGPQRSELTATILASNGWKHTVVVAPQATRPAGSELSGPVDLRGLLDVAREVETLSGASPGSYQLRLTLDVESDGADKGAADRHETSTAAFPLDPTQLRPPADAADGAPAPSSQAVTWTETVRTPGSVSLAGRRLPVPWVRWAGVAGIALGAIGLAVGILGRKRIDAARLARRSRSRTVVTIRSAPGGDADVIEVASYEALERLAVRYDRMVLHQPGSAGDDYFVSEGGAVYRHRSGCGADDPQRSGHPAPLVAANVCLTSS